MPVVPLSVTAPYDTVGTVLGFVVAIANDGELSIGGDLLSGTEPQTLPLFNLGWRKCQEELIDNGVDRMTPEIDIYGIPPNLNQDPASQAYIGYTECFDGTNYWNTPLLPQNLVEPKRLWQRQTGSNSEFTDVSPANDGLTSRTAGAWISAWDWRQDRIYYNGSNQAMDLRLRYDAYFTDFVAGQDGSFPVSAQVPVMRIALPLAYYVAAMFAGGRGGEYYAALIAEGKEWIQKVVNRTARKKQRGNHRKQPYSMGNQWGVYGW